MKQRNQNRHGYKHTKVGWIPEDWDIHRIREVAHVVTGSTPSTNNPHYYNGEFLFVGPSDLAQNKYILKSEKTLSADGFASCRAIPEGGILFTCIGSTIGKMAIAGKTLATNQQINSVIVKKHVSVEYIYYALLYLSSRIKLLAGEQAVPIVNKNDFSSIMIPFPPQMEQGMIAKILSAWERAIELMDKLIDAKQRLKKGLMQQLLTGRIRFPEFEPQNKRKKIDKSKLPEEWKWKKLGECLDKILGGGTPSKNRPNYWNGDIPWATVKDISRGNISDTIDHISINGLKESSSNLIPPGTVLMCTRMAVGKTICFECATAINQDLKALFPNKQLNKDFLLVLLRFHENYFASLGGGSTVTGIRLEELRDFRFPLPTIQEQIKIASCLSAIDREIQLLSRKRDLLQKQKKGLMQKLLTGEIRVGKNRQASHSKISTIFCQ